jgi:hypothetical protein
VPPKRRKQPERYMPFALKFLLLFEKSIDKKNKGSYDFGTLNGGCYGIKTGKDK